MLNIRADNQSGYRFYYPYKRWLLLAKVKAEEKQSAVSLPFFFCAWELLRIPRLIHGNCSMWHWSPLIRATVNSASSPAFCVGGRSFPVLCFGSSYSWDLFLLCRMVACACVPSPTVIQHSLWRGRATRALPLVIPEQRGGGEWVAAAENTFTAKRFPEEIIARIGSVPFAVVLRLRLFQLYFTGKYCFTKGYFSPHQRWRRVVVGW